ncbi:MAG: hypothetical protein H0W88_09765 [Parachlamydiaceae bacterium]|nr:hypothetical protein [Parachlamydiaceae bacterium]
MEFLQITDTNEFNATLEGLLSAKNVDEVSFSKRDNRYKPIHTKNQSFALSIYRWFQNYFCNRREKVILDIFAFMKINFHFAHHKKEDIRNLGDRLITQVHPSSKKHIQDVFNNFIKSCNTVDDAIVTCNSNYEARLNEVNDIALEIEKKENIVKGQVERIISEANAESDGIRMAADSVMAKATTEAQRINEESSAFLQKRKNEINDGIEAYKQQKENEIKDACLQVSQKQNDELKKTLLDVVIRCKDDKRVGVSSAVLKEEIPFFSNLTHFSSFQKQDTAETQPHQISLSDDPENPEYSEKTITNFLLVVDEVIFLKQNTLNHIGRIHDQLKNGLGELNLLFGNVITLLKGNIQFDEGADPIYHIQAIEEFCLEQFKIIKSPFETFVDAISKVKNNKIQSVKLLENFIKNPHQDIQNTSSDAYTKFNERIQSLIKYLNFKSIDSNHSKFQSQLNEEVRNIQKNIERLNEIDKTPIEHIQTPILFQDIACQPEDLFELIKLANFLSYECLQYFISNEFANIKFTSIELIDWMIKIPDDIEWLSDSLSENAGKQYFEISLDPRFHQISPEYLLKMVKAIKGSFSERSLFTSLQQYCEKKFGSYEVLDKKIKGERLLDHVRFEHFLNIEFDKIKSILPLEDQQHWAGFFNKTKSIPIRPIRLDPFNIVHTTTKNTMSFRIPLARINHLLNLQQGEETIQYFNIKTNKFRLVVGNSNKNGHNGNRVYISVMCQKPCPDFHYKFNIAGMVYDSRKKTNNNNVVANYRSKLLGLKQTPIREAVISYKPEDLRPYFTADGVIELILTLRLLK